MGRVISSTLVVYINTQGAWLVALVLGGAGLYFASDINFWTLKTQIEDRWLNLVAWHDRYATGARNAPSASATWKSALPNRLSPVPRSGFSPELLATHLNPPPKSTPAAPEPPGRSLRHEEARPRARSSG